MSRKARRKQERCSLIEKKKKNAKCKQQRQEEYNDDNHRPPVAAVTSSGGGDDDSWSPHTDKGSTPPPQWDNEKRRHRRRQPQRQQPTATAATTTNKGRKRDRDDASLDATHHESSSSSRMMREHISRSFEKETKRHHERTSNTTTTTTTIAARQQPQDSAVPNEKKKKEKSSTPSPSPYGHLDASAAAALRREDEEIAALEAKLGIIGGGRGGGSAKKNQNKKDQLYAEYSKQEGYGDDFGSFLEDLDDMVARVGTGGGGGETATRERSDDRGGGNDDDDSSSSGVPSSSSSSGGSSDQEHDNEDEDEDEAEDEAEDVDARVVRRRREDSSSVSSDDDEEEEILVPMKRPALTEDDTQESKGTSDRNGHGSGNAHRHDEDESGRFADDGNHSTIRRDRERKDSDREDDDDDDSSDNDDDEEHGSENNDADDDDNIANDDEDHDSFSDDDNNDGDDESDSDNHDDDENDGDSNDVGANDDDENDFSDDNDEEEEPDHDPKYTYRPTAGQDIYGNQTNDDERNSGKPGKYVPPHLRKKREQQQQQQRPSNRDAAAASASAAAAEKEQADEIRRDLNRALNRLSSADTLIPTAAAVADVYRSNSKSMVHEQVWKCTAAACISGKTIVVVSLIPLHVAALVAVHIRLGDAYQVAEYVMEKVVVALWKQLEVARSAATNDDKKNKVDDDDDNNAAIINNKEVCNLMLVLCYLYNYGVVHCSLLYDMIRRFIQHCTEIDVELVLIVLRHCGRTLRSDDPTALKEIVLLVLEQRRRRQNDSCVSPSSRVRYMVSAMEDLKNNKRRRNPKDAALAETTAKFKRALGRVKSAANSSNNSTVARSDASLRITLQDLLQAETTGRWWKVGATWRGGGGGGGIEFGRHDDDKKQQQQERETAPNASGNSKEEERLLRLARKMRMNTADRRSVFCIVMGSTDCDDCLESLVRAGMLRRKEQTRDVVRVIIECCRQEKGAYNPYYAHLSARICRYQPQCKFSFQLAFWDTFKQFGDDGVSPLSPRKVANLAKFLYALVAVHGVLKLSVLKGMDDWMSLAGSSPQELPENTLLFLTIFLTNILNHYDRPQDAHKLFSGCIIVARKDKKDPTNHEFDARKHDRDDDDRLMADHGEALCANLTVFMMQILKASPHYRRKGSSKFKANLKAALEACDADNFF